MKQPEAPLPPPRTKRGGVNTIKQPGIKRNESPKPGSGAGSCVRVWAASDYAIWLNRRIKKPIDLINPRIKSSCATARLL